MRQSDPRVRPVALPFKNIIPSADAILRVAVEDELVIGYVLGWHQHSSYGPLPSGTVVIEELVLDAHKYYGGLGRALVNAFREHIADEHVADEHITDEHVAEAQIFVLVPRYHAVDQAFWRSMGARTTDQFELKIPVTFLWMILQ